MNFSENTSDVRADRFRESGKWYDTFAIDMTGLYNHLDPAQAVKVALTKKGIVLATGWMIVVLYPYHEHSYPVMIRGT